MNKKRKRSTFTRDEWVPTDESSFGDFDPKRGPIQNPNSTRSEPLTITDNKNIQEQFEIMRLHAFIELAHENTLYENIIAKENAK
jgi:hypothetical protein